MWVYSKSVFTFKTQSSSNILQGIKQHAILYNFRHFKLVGLIDIITNIEAIFLLAQASFHPFCSALQFIY